MTFRRFFPSFLLVSALAPCASARPSDYQTNVREACRQAVAGGYLKVYDEREKLTVYVKSLEEQVKATDVALAKARVELAKAKDAAAKQSFDLAVASRRDEAATTVQNLESQRADYLALKVKSVDSLAKAKTGEHDLKLTVDKVFAFERTEDKADGGYPIQIAYRSPCPKYRHLCPLPPRDAELLVKIIVDGASPEACGRYASLSKIR